MAASSKLVLITGATGHIGFRVLVLLLRAGYRARVTVRKLEQAKKIKNTASIKPFLDLIDFVQVPDITAPTAFDEAIQGVEFVLHIASPIPPNMTRTDTNWKEIFVDPAVEGTTSILKSAAKTPSVKRVVITSSVVVTTPKPGSDRPGPYDIRTPRDQASVDALIDPFEAYIESKVAAHVAATEFKQRENPSFDLIRVLPGYVQGQNELCQTREELTSGSNEATIEVAIGHRTEGPKLTAQVLLDDVANAHVLVLDRSIAKDGDCFLVAGNGGNGTPWSEVASIISKTFPEEVNSGVLKPLVDQENYLTKFDVTSSERALGYRFAGAEEMVKSLVGQYVALQA